MLMTETILGTPLPIVRRRLKNRAPVLRLPGPSFNKVLTRAGRATEHVAAACVAILLFATSGQAAERQALRGHVPRAIADLNLQPVGLLSGTNRLHLAIGLPLRNQEALTNLLQQIYDPASPEYRHYLTPEQFTDKFGPTMEDYQAVIAFAKANGFTVTGTHPNRVLLDVEGAASNVEKAFQVKMLDYQHPTEARTFYAPDVEPSVPSGIKILDISGISSYPRPHPMSHVGGLIKQGSRPTPNAGSEGGQYIGNDFRAAYVPGTPLTGAGQSVALVQFDGYYLSDITRYETLAGLPAITLTNILLNGFSGVPTTGTLSGNGEVSLDIEMVNSMAPGIAKLFLYEGNPAGGYFNPNDVLSRIANDNAAKQVSCSWGWNGGPQTSTDTILMQMISQGQTFFVASGDSDAYPGTTVDNSNQYGTPVASAYVTSVGGTTLSTSGPTNNWVSETVWNWGVEYGSSENGVGSSGGYSSYYAIPTWQQGVPTNNLGSATGRNFPDVALTADHVFVAYGNGNTNWFGGTSCAAPLWAGFTALVNQQGAANGKPPVGFLNPAIYTIGTGKGYTVCFHDITTGNNEWSNSPSAYSATTGYDLCTGWGTPNGTNLINALVGPPTNLPNLVVSSTVVSGGNGNGVIDADECNLLNLIIQNIGGVTATTVNATLTTTTPGVTITQPVATYPDVLPGFFATNTPPFQVSTSPSFVCGTPVSLSLVLSYTGGAATNTITMPTCTCPTIQVSGGLSRSSPTQVSALWPDGKPSACSAAKSCPGTYAAGTVAYNAYSYTNSSSAAACVSVTVSTTCSSYSSIFSEAYLSNYNPSSLCINYLADMGGYDGEYSGPGTFGYSFTVPANTNFTVVVNAMASGHYCSSYTLTVAGVPCLVDGGGACAGVSASFSGTPTNGVAPLAVTFTDTSTGTITNRFWDFGDSNTTNFTVQTSPVHTYGAGVYTVTLVVSGPAGVSTNIQLNAITVLTPFAAWQVNYFGCTNCPQAVPDADPLGKGMSNTNQFLAGLNPTNSASALRIISVAQQSNDVVITWTTAGVRTNAVQATAGDAIGNYTNTFVDISGLIIIPGSGDATTNYLDSGGATNAPSRYYRIRLVP
jgi:PKD repeat protein